MIYTQIHNVRLYNNSQNYFLRVVYPKEHRGIRTREKRALSAIACLNYKN